MKMVQAGDTSQLALLFEQYHLPLFRYLLQMTRNRELSEDLVQEVFMRVLKYARTYNPAMSFQPWLYGVARNVYLDARHKRRPEVSTVELDEMRSHDPVPEEVFSRKQDLKLLEHALQQLPEDKREVLVLSRFHNLKYEEIARVLSCEVGTVKVRAFRALKELRERLCELRGERIYDV
jgi:RNA polymerase sigma-70 factor (ECF subfamily)